jgi:hypothetical protein
MLTNRSRAARTLLSLITVLMLLLGSAASVLAQATPDATPGAGDAGPSIGDAVVLHDSGGDETIQVAVTELVDPDEDAGSADRGFHWVGLQVVVDNPTDGDIEFNSYAISVIDVEGFLYSPGFASRDQADSEARPDFSTSTIPAGESVSGWLFYQVINGAEPSWIILNDSFTTQQFAVLANVTGDPIEDGAEIPFYDSNADEIGTVSVDEIITDFQDVDPGITPTRGMSAVGVVVTIANSGDAEIQPNSFSFYLVDDFGLIYYPQFYFRDASTAEYPDLPTDPLAAGAEATGAVFFEIPRDAEISYIYYAPDYTQLYILAQPGPGSTVSGDTLTPAAVPTSDAGDDEEPTVAATDEATEESTGQETGDCEGVAVWVDAATDQIAVLQELSFANEESLETVPPEDLREAADMLNDAADALEELETPEAAQSTNDAVIEMFTIWADLFDEAADRLDAGEDPADIQADFDENEGFQGSFETVFTEITALATACPESGVEGLFG